MPINIYTSGPGYNGVTGAKATYNAAEGMWVDTNGDRIRTDAIIPGDPPSAGSGGGTSAAAPAATTPQAAASSPMLSKGGIGGSGGSTPLGTLFNFGGPAAANPALGRTNPAMEGLRKLYQRKPTIY